MFKKFLPVLALAIFLPALSACGFTPLYADATQQGGLQSRLDAITIEPITKPATTGYLFQRELENRFGGAASPKWSLNIRLSESRTSVAVTSSADTNRFAYKLEAKYRFTHAESGKVFSGALTSSTGYGVVPSQYSSFVGEEEARRKTITDLASQIELDIALALKGFEE